MVGHPVHSPLEVSPQTTGPHGAASRDGGRSSPPMRAVLRGRATLGMIHRPMSKASIVMPVHNRRDTTVACLRELRAQGVLTWAHVIVVDDGSSGGTSKGVRAECPEATLLH